MNAARKPGRIAAGAFRSARDEELVQFQFLIRNQATVLVLAAGALAVVGIISIAHMLSGGALLLTAGATLALLLTANVALDHADDLHRRAARRGRRRALRTFAADLERRRALRAGGVAAQRPRQRERADGPRPALMKWPYECLSIGRALRRLR